MTQAGGSLFERIPKYAKSDIPPILTKKDWDKKKGVFAKIVSGKTGIGEQCDKVAAAYKAAKFDRLDLNTQLRNNGFDSWRSDGFTTANYQKLISAANSEVAGSVRKVVDEIYKLSTLCKDTEKKFRANGKIPKASAEHVAKMAKAADFFGTGLNSHSYGEYLKKVDAGIHGWLKDAVASNIVASQKSVPLKISNGLKALEAKADAATLNEFSRDAIRALNQAVGNAGKYGERGWGKGGSAYVAQFKKLEPLARGRLVDDGATETDVKAAVKNIMPELKKGLDLLAAFKA